MRRGEKSTKTEQRGKFRNLKPEEEAVLHDSDDIRVTEAKARI